MWSLNDGIISLQEFRSKISDECIYQHYLGNFNNNSWFSAPWRSDTTPSLQITYYKGEWVWRDFGEDVRPNNAINFLKRYYNIEFPEVLTIAYNDIVNNDGPLYIKKTPIIKPDVSYLELNDISNSEMWYWNKANIDKTILKKFDVYSGNIKHNGITWHNSTPEDPLYIYMYDINNEIYKGYRPLSKSKLSKFYSHNITNHIQGYSKLPGKGNNLIITKSYKDVLIWYKAGYPAIAPHSESMFINDDIFKELKQRFKNVFLNYDNDTTGMEQITKFSSKYPVIPLIIPILSKCKDPFEFITNNNSYNQLNNLILSKLETCQT